MVVLPILKNISQWEGLSHILWKIKNVPNHQPVYQMGPSKNPDINQMVFPRVIVFFPLIVFPSAGFTPS